MPGFFREACYEIKPQEGEKYDGCAFDSSTPPVVREQKWGEIFYLKVVEGPDPNKQQGR